MGVVGPNIDRCISRKGLQVTESLEASPPLKNWRQGVERAVLSFRNA
jgi:hypothetical protein